MISPDRQYYTGLSSESYRKCKQSYFSLCPNAITLKHHTVNECVYALFMGLDVRHGKCNRVLVQNVISPYWVQIGNDWVFSVSESYKPVLNCLKVDDENSSILTNTKVTYELELKNQVF